MSIEAMWQMVHEQFNKPKDHSMLYTAPPKREWVSLTDDEIKEIIGYWETGPIKGYKRELFDKIDAKLREKNGG